MRRRLPVGVNLTARCNATCSHCCMESSPRAGSMLTDEAVDSIINDLLSHDDVKEVGFSGGEVLLRAEAVTAWIRRLSSAGKRVTLVTNAFWAVTKSRAQLMVRQLKEAGLTSMTISYDDFHTSFVSPDRVRRALDACKAEPLNVQLSVAVTKSSIGWDSIKVLGPSVHRVPVTQFAAQPVGRGKSVPAEHLFTTPIGENLTCPGLQPVFHFDGSVYPCCSPAVFSTVLKVGEASEKVEQILSKMERSLFFAVLRKEGLGWFLERMRERRDFQSHPALSLDEVTAPCELCGILFQDASVIQGLREDVLRYRCDDVKDPQFTTLH